jgi:hypothetical protein
MLEKLITPADCRRRIRIHTIVYDQFAANVRDNSSAPSLENFLTTIFTPVGQEFHTTFGAGLDITYVRQQEVRDLVANPPLKEKDRQKMREIYTAADAERKIIFDMIIYDFVNKDKTHEAERPHIILALLGDKEVRPKHMDFYKFPVYLGGRDAAGTSAGRYCTAGINTVIGSAYTITHELGHSFGADHTEEDDVMQPSMIHGRTKYRWSEKNRKAVQARLEEMGI